MDLIVPLSQPRVDYVLYHWGLHVDLNDNIRNRFSIKNVYSDDVTGKVIFLQATSPLQIKAWESSSLPTLFPVLANREFYFLDDRNNLVFTHDVLKAIFFLLSGIQETDLSAQQDNLSRYAFENSIQCKGRFIQKPLVNYYYEKMTEGLEKFCTRNDLGFKRRRLFKDFGLLLSHDIDRVDLYTLNQFAYHVKEVLGMTSSQLPLTVRLRAVKNTFFKWSRILKYDNPYWNFEFLREVERKHGFSSTFFFLDKGVRHADAYHTFSEMRMRQLFRFLLQERCEIAMHGATYSNDDRTVMERNKKNLEENSNVNVIGNRQHRLQWRHPKTAIIEESLGLQYDATLGFAAHEGFRNSYCYPFKLYDFQNERMLDLWEFPLQVMDGTLFAYRKLSVEEAMKSCVTILEEVKKFGGVFSLLWHNSFFDETTYPGITNFYKQLLSYIASEKAESFTHMELLDSLKLYNE